MSKGKSFLIRQINEKDYNEFLKKFSSYPYSANQIFKKFINEIAMGKLIINKIDFFDFNITERKEVK